MALRTKLLLYLVLLHLNLAVLSGFLLARNRLWLLVIELAFAVSLFLGVLLVRSLALPRLLVRAGTESIGEGDFTSRLRPVGHPEVDRFVDVYNTIAGRLREKRVQLEEQQLFLDRVLGASPAGVLTLDLDGRVSQLNPSMVRLLGEGAEAVIGRRPGELNGPLVPLLADLAPGESRIAPLGGARRAKASRAEFYDRGFARTFFVVEELTEELRASEKATHERLIRIMSHEVNNTAGAVISLLGSLREHGGSLPADDRADFEEALSVAGTRMEHLADFMRGFAEFVQLPPPEPRPCDVGQLVRDVTVLLGPELARRRIELRWRTGGELPPIALDKNQIEQVLVNLLKNAMEAIGEDGIITLALGRGEDGRPYLEIADSGGGVAPEVEERLFTPFFSTRPGGLGLGLALTREILRQHRFELTLDNRRGEGCTFRIGLAAE